MTSFEPLFSWGWDSDWDFVWNEISTGLPPSLVPARVIGQDGPILRLQTANGPSDGLLTGKFLYTAAAAELPLVGDWVAVLPVDSSQSLVQAVLPRRTVFGRLEGPVGANIDELAIVTGLDGNFNVRRALRLATLARAGGIGGLWLLTKSDLPNVEPKIAEARRVAGQTDVVALSSVTGDGFDVLRERWTKGRTIVLAGSSGVGKTTLINRLLGASLATAEVRTDSRGRHSTTARHLYPLPSGGLLMDTPGFRSVGLWANSADLNEEFSDVAEWAALCRFSDCRHENEPGCAVRAALDAGDLDADRWDAWRRQRRELRYLERKDDLTLRLENRDHWKAIQKKIRGFTKEGRSRLG